MSQRGRDGWCCWEWYDIIIGTGGCHLLIWGCLSANVIKSQQSAKWEWSHIGVWRQDGTITIKVCWPQLKKHHLNYWQSVSHLSKSAALWLSDSCHLTVRFTTVKRDCDTRPDLTRDTLQTSHLMDNVEVDVFTQKQSLDLTAVTQVSVQHRRHFHS